LRLAAPRSLWERRGLIPDIVEHLLGRLLA
jgi:hypothetical protein